jgi:hypothetical protein
MIRHKTDGWAAKNIIGNKSQLKFFAFSAHQRFLSQRFLKCKNANSTSNPAIIILATMAVLDEDASGCLAIDVEAGSWLVVGCVGEGDEATLGAGVAPGSRLKVSVVTESGGT